MAADNIKIADRKWELGNSKSKIFNTEKVIYYFDGVWEGNQFASLNIFIKYKKSDIGYTLTVNIDAKILPLTDQEQKCIASLANKSNTQEIQKTWQNASLSRNVEEKIKQCITILEKKETAIAWLEQYRNERKENTADYNVLPCILNFFKGTRCEFVLGISRKDKLDAVDKIMKWLESSKRQVCPQLVLDETDIKALTNKGLGDKIKEIRELDPEFDAAFKDAIRRSEIATTSSLSLVING